MCAVACNYSKPIALNLMIHLNFVVAIINNFNQKWANWNSNGELIKNYERVIFDILWKLAIRFHLNYSYKVMTKVCDPDLMWKVKIFVTILT